MATLATAPFVQPVNRIAGLLPPPGKEIGRPLRAQPTPGLVQIRQQEHGPEVMFAWLLVPLALLATVLWPVLFAAVVLLVVGLTPFVVGFKVLTFLIRGRRAAG